MPLSTASQFFRTDPLDRILRRFCGGRRWPRPQGGELGRGVQTQSQRKVTPTVSRGPHKARHGKKNTWYYCDLHSIITELTPNAAHFIQFGCLVLKDFQTTVTSVWSRTIYLCNKWRILFFHWWNFSIFTYSVGPLTLWGEKATSVTQHHRQILYMAAFPSFTKRFPLSLDLPQHRKPMPDWQRTSMNNICWKLSPSAVASV